MAEKKPLPWWLDQGSENCGSCLQSYPRRQGRYCAGCDRHVCDACLARVGGEWLCPECLRHEHFASPERQAGSDG